MPVIADETFPSESTAITAISELLDGLPMPEALDIMLTVISIMFGQVIVASKSPDFEKTANDMIEFYSPMLKQTALMEALRQGGMES